MAYNPGVHDMSGQILASGIDRGIAALGDGIRRAQEERRRKEEEKRAKEAVQAAGSALFGEGFDLKDAPRDSWGQIIQLAQAKREEPIRQLQMTAAELANQNAALNQALMALQADRTRAQFDQEERNRAAVSVALDPTADTAAAIRQGASFENLPRPGAVNIDTAVRRAGVSGADVKTLDTLSETLRRAQPATGPVLTDFNGVPAILDRNGNVQFIPQPRPAAQPRGLAVEIAQLAKARDEALAAGNTELADTFGKAMQAKAQGRGDDLGALAAAIAAGLGGDRQPNTPKPSPGKPTAEPAKTPAAVPTKKGTRVRQNGQVYEFDGTQWNPI